MRFILASALRAASSIIGATALQPADVKYLDIENCCAALTIKIRARQPAESIFNWLGLYARCRRASMPSVRFAARADIAVE